MSLENTVTSPDSPSPHAKRVTVDDRNTMSFRVPHRTSSSNRTPTRPEGPTQHQIATRLKTVVSDALAYAQAHPNDSTAALDHFIAIAEDAVKDFKQLRVDVRLRGRSGGGGTATAAAAGPAATGGASPMNASVGRGGAALLPPSSAAAAAHDASVESVDPRDLSPMAPASRATQQPSSNRVVHADPAAAVSPSTPTKVSRSATPSATNAGYQRDATAPPALGGGGGKASAWARPLQFRGPQQQQQQQQQPSAASSTSQQQPPSAASTSVGGMASPGPAAVDAAQTAEERALSAARSAERQADAEARRKLMLAERQQKLEEKADRVAEAKARRDAADAKLRDDSQARNERAERLRAKELEKKKEAPARDTAKVEEAQFVRSAEAENRAIDLDEKLKNTERNNEALQQQRQSAAKERNDVREQAVLRAKSAERMKHETQVQKVQAKEEQRLRKDDEKRRETQEKVMRHEERRERVVEQQLKAQAEVEARHTKLAGRQENSEKQREAYVMKQREKGEKQDAKIKEARERRDREAGKTKLEGVYQPRDDEAMAAAEEAVKRCVALSARHAKSYLEAAVVPAAAAKCKLRAVIARFSSAQGNPAQFRQPLHELSQVFSDGVTAVDLAFLRSAHGIPVVVDVYSRLGQGNAGAAAVSRLLIDTVVRFVTCTVDRSKNLEFFVRSGCLGKIIEQLWEEVKKVPRVQATGAHLSAGLTIFYACSDFVIHEGRGRPELQIYRQILFEAYNALAIGPYALSLAMVALQEDMPTLQAALAIMRCYFSARKPQAKDATSPTTVKEDGDQMCTALMTCVASMLMPGGTHLKPDVTVPPAATGVLFLALRLLNDFARRELRLLQELVADPSTSVVFSHVVTAVCSYVLHKQTELEALAANVVPPGMAGNSPSFSDALKAGITWDRFPVIDSTVKKAPCFLRASFNELLLLVGYVAINNAAVQGVFAYGHDTPLLCNVIAALPIAYFGVAKHVAFPSLLAVCFRHPRNLDILRNEIDVEALESFLQKEIAAHGPLPPPPALQPASTSAAAAAGGAAGQPGTPSDGEALVPPMRAPPAPISWADIMDDDDEDVDELFARMNSQTAAAQSAAAAAATSSTAFAAAASSVSNASLPDVEATHAQVSKAVGPTNANRKEPLPYACFFRFDKRFAAGLWMEALEQLQQQQQAPTPAE